MNNFLPPGLHALKGAQDARASMSAVLGLSQTISAQQNLWRTIGFPFEELSRHAAFTTTVFGLSKAFQDYHRFADMFQPLKLEFNPALSGVITQYRTLSESVAQVVNARKPWASLISNQWKAMGLATQLSSLTLPKGIFDWLEIDADALRDDIEIAEMEIDEAISSINTPSADANVMETLDKISEVLAKLEARVDTIAIIQDTDERERQLVKYDRFIA